MTKQLQSAQKLDGNIKCWGKSCAGLIERQRIEKAQFQQ